MSLDDEPLDSDGLFPWRYFLRTLGAVFQMRVLLIAVAASVATELGDAAFLKLTGYEIVQPCHTRLPGDGVSFAWSALLGPVTHWQTVVLPFWGLLAFSAHAFLGVWRLAVAVIAGGLIARQAALTLGYREPSSAGLASGRTLNASAKSLITLLIVMLLVGGLLLPLLLHAWAMRIPGLGIVSAALLPVPLLFSLAAAVLSVCGALGWPLLTAASVVERPDPFDAASRAFAYVTQRVPQLAAYAATALLVGAPVGALLMAIGGFGLAASGAVLHSAVDSNTLAGRLAGFWPAELFNLLPQAFFVAYFWCATTAVYLLLRRDVDGVMVDEIEEPAS